MTPYAGIIRSFVIALALLSSSSVMAGILFFENPPPGQEGHFNWHLNLPDDPETFEQWLDITRPSTDQFGLATGNSVGQLFRENGGDSRNLTFGGAAVALAPNSGLTRAFAFGEDISTGDFNTLGLHAIFSGGQLLSDFQDGVPAYIGVKTADDRFGWIAVVRHGNSLNLTTTGWAYETEPGVPIRAGEIPGVGGIALFGLLGLTSRRRRTP